MNISYDENRDQHRVLVSQPKRSSMQLTMEDGMVIASLFVDVVVLFENSSPRQSTILVYMNKKAR